VALPTLFRRGRQEAPAQEERGLSWPDNSKPPLWSEVSGGQGYTPLPITLENMVGLPAVSAAIRLVAETIASMPLVVYSGHDADKRRAADSWQYGLLHELPGMGDFTPFDFIADVAASVEAAGNAFIQKVTAAGRVVALIVIDPARVEVKRDKGAKVFVIRNANGHSETYTATTILHIRGFTVNGSDLGLSPVGVHRRKLGAVMARDEFEGRFFGQGTNLGVAIEIPGDPNVDQQKSILRRWIANHSGLSTAHLPALLTNGAKIARVGMNLNDAQFVESEKLNLTQVANIFRVPASWLGAEAPIGNNEQETLRLYMALLPRLRRIELALRSDPDLFPDRTLYPEFDTSFLMRTDAKTQAEVDHMRVQDGSRLVDEIRARDGLGPLPPIPDDPTQEPGKVPQLTPVGGQANPNQDQAPPEPRQLVIGKIRLTH
jgi:HK97 family phage portal protein